MYSLTHPGPGRSCDLFILFIQVGLSTYQSRSTSTYLGRSCVLSVQKHLNLSRQVLRPVCQEEPPLMQVGSATCQSRITSTYPGKSFDLSVKKHLHLSRQMLRPVSLEALQSRQNLRPVNPGSSPFIQVGLSILLVKKHLHLQVGFATCQSRITSTYPVRSCDLSVQKHLHPSKCVLRSVNSEAPAVIQVFC